MEKGVPILIERIGNGWAVRPSMICSPVPRAEDIMAFQELRDGDGGETLFSWLEQHFAEPK